jgi:hypothetical protein
LPFGKTLLELSDSKMRAALAADIEKEYPCDLFVGVLPEPLFLLPTWYGI